MVLGTWMGGVVDLLHAGGGDVGVDLGAAEVGVAEAFLDAAEVGSVVEEVGGEAVAEVFLEEVIDGAHGEAAAELAEEEGGLVDASR